MSVSVYPFHFCRLHGLLLLEAVLCQCSAEVFSSSCQTWMQLLLQALQVQWGWGRGRKTRKEFLFI